MRHLVLVLGDQLDEHAAAFDDFDPKQDVVWMAEATEESTHVPSSQVRTALFLSAMRHFAARLRRRGIHVNYVPLDEPGHTGTLAGELGAAIEALRPLRLVMTAPGDWRVLQAIKAVSELTQVPLDIREDRHFFCTVREFAEFARKRRSLRMEFFYRHLRQRHRVLMVGDEPAGGRWNFDEDNRESFGTQGPKGVPRRVGEPPDRITREVIALVREHFPHHVGELDHFDWPVTREQAQAALKRFIEERLPHFGRYEDAMWPGEPWLYHSQLSAALNLKLLDPREVVNAAEAAWRAGHVPLASAEGFIRQILGWREYVRGIYWTHMPRYLQRNALVAHGDLPWWFWNGETDMACLSDALRQTLSLGYAHHIQRLMVIGQFALLWGVDPKQVHAWYLAVYVDAVEWVELPNTLGMSQYADGGLMASKPYAASGRYIQRMGGPCKQCRYDPTQRTGERACPYTTMYWDFLLRHADTLAGNPRMAMPVASARRIPADEQAALRARAEQLRQAAQGDADE